MLLRSAQTDSHQWKQTHFGYLVICKRRKSLIGNTWDKVLDHIHVGQGVDGSWAGFFVNVGQAGQIVATINVHGTGTADTFTARSRTEKRILKSQRNIITHAIYFEDGFVPAESKTRVLFVLDFDQRVENHWATSMSINRISKCSINELSKLTRQDQRDRYSYKVFRHCRGPIGKSWSTLGCRWPTIINTPQ